MKTAADKLNELWNGTDTRAFWIDNYCTKSHAEQNQYVTETAPAGLTPTAAPDTLFIDELTWEETRDAMRAGKTTIIVPTGGTEKDGYHMVLGKHNFVAIHAANQIARRAIKNPPRGRGQREGR